MSDETSSGVDVAKLCARENPLVHYYRVAARGVLPLLSFGLLAAGTLGFQAFVLLQISEAPSGRAYGEDASSIFVGDLVAGRITTMLFCIWTVLLVTAFQSLVFRILGRDPRRDEGIVHLVLTPLTSNQILWGSIRTPLLVSLIVVGTTLAMTVVKLEIMFDLISSWRTIIRTSTLDLILAFFIVTMFSTYLNVKGYVIGGVQGALLSLAAPFASIPIFILGMSYILNSANSPMRMMLGSSIMVSVPSRFILQMLGAAALVLVVQRAIRGELVPHFMKGAHPEESVRAYWYARELAARGTQRDALLAGRKRLSAILGRDRIADFLVVIASQLGSIILMQGLYFSAGLDEFFQGSFFLSLACIFSTCCVVLRRIYIKPRPGLPVVSGDLRASLRRWYTPIAMAQIVGASLPLLFSVGMRVNYLQYALSVLAGMLLGYVMLLVLIPTTTRLATARATAKFLVVLASVVVITALADKLLVGSFIEDPSVPWGHVYSPPISFTYYTGFVLRAFAWFFAIALVMDLRGLLLQRIHESEVLDHPIGALSTDPLPIDHATKGTAPA